MTNSRHGCFPVGCAGLISVGRLRQNSTANMEMNLREVVVRQMCEMKNSLLGAEGDQETFWPVSSGDFFLGVWRSLRERYGKNGPSKCGCLNCWLVN